MYTFVGLFPVLAMKNIWPIPNGYVWLEDGIYKCEPII